MIRKAISRIAKPITTSKCNASTIISTTRSLSDVSNDDPSLVRFVHDSDANIGIIELHQPSMQNALTIELASQFKSKVQEITESILNPSDNLDVNSIILTGSNSTFSAGGDLKWLKQLRQNPVHVNADIMYDFYKSFLCIRDLPVPVIAVMDGHAIGAGACLAIAVDMRIMSSKAKIGFNFVRLGIHSGMGGSHFLPIVVGESNAMEILLTGQVLSGQEAKDIGLVHKVVNIDDCIDERHSIMMEEGKKLAKKIGNMHPLAVRSMVQTMRMRENAFGGGLEASLRREAYAQALCYAREDWGEGLDATVERRQPSFDGYHSDSEWI